MSSTLDKEKQTEEEEKRKRKEKKDRQKHTEEENLKKINLQQSEKLRLNYVFNQLCELENEKSSDDDSKSKKYLRAINEKAKKKQMKIEKPKYKSNFEKINKKKYKNKEEEDEEEKEKKPAKKKFSQKALRKIIRKLCNEFAKDELANMIWEVDHSGHFILRRRAIHGGDGVINRIGEVLHHARCGLDGGVSRNGDGRRQVGHVGTFGEIQRHRIGILPDEALDRIHVKAQNGFLAFRALQIRLLLYIACGHAQNKGQRHRSDCHYSFHCSRFYLFDV